jgi:CRISPR/Cas system-associated exonuclease Cas4 (RecB family)
MPGKHALWSPSGSPYWFNDGRGCPARVLLPPKPETPSPAAAEGTRLHDLAEQYLDGGSPTLTDEDWSAIGPYCEYIESQIFNPMVNTTVEVQVDLEPITGEVDATGTIDCLVCSDTYLEVVDLKTGAKIVEPTSNQLKMYAAAAVEELDYTGEHVRCTIHQGGKAHTVVYNTEEVIAFGEEIRGYIYAVEQEADAGHLRYVPGEKNCQWCPHVIDCEAQAGMRNEIAAREFAVSEDPVQLAGDLALVGALRRWCDEVESRSLRAAEGGAVLPGFKLVRARTNRRWSEDAEEKLFELLGDAAYTRKLIGLTEAGKLVDAETMNELTVKPEGRPTLAPEDDKRPAINDAAADFTNA